MVEPLRGKGRNFPFLEKTTLLPNARFPNQERNNAWGLSARLSPCKQERQFRPFFNESLKRAHRKPMFVLELDGALFRFRAKTPALEVLFQLPPRWKARTLYRHYPSPARQMIAPFGDYASGGADKSAKTDLSAPPKIIENVKIKMKNYCIILNYKTLKSKCYWR
ncbi:MAG: hypothetical protein WA093_04750, partial [Minisyncoccales bacterium]